jgi:cell division protein YceG involved in septum cleavage
MQFLLLTWHIVKNPGMNTDAVEGYVVPVTYKIHRQETREWTQMLLKGMQFLLLTRYIVKKPGNEHRCCWRVCSSCYLHDTSSRNQEMNTEAVVGYAVSVTYKIHRQKTREWTQVLSKGMQFLLLTSKIVKKSGNEHRCCWRVCSSCYLQDTSSKNQEMNTDAVKGYVVPVTYKTHRQETREWTQMLLKGM